jgi:hypothetical protein
LGRLALRVFSTIYSDKGDFSNNFNLLSEAERIKKGSMRDASERVLHDSQVIAFFRQFAPTTELAVVGLNKKDGTLQFVIVVSVTRDCCSLSINHQKCTGEK